MKHAVVASIGVLLCVWWWCHRRDARPSSDDVSRKAAVLVDLANDRRGLRWYSVEHHDDVSWRTVQQGPATVEVWKTHRAKLETRTWSIVVNLDRIKDIVCERRHYHAPEPPHVALKLSFRADPPENEHGYANELFGVLFDQARQADYVALCQRHGLRKEGDW
jgi:hypothetical protein